MMPNRAMHHILSGYKHRKYEEYKHDKLTQMNRFPVYFAIIKTGKSTGE